MGPPMTQDEAARRQAELLLDRYGILAREFYRNESLLPWSLLCAHLQMMELRGEIRRGYFVSGLSGMQFAHPRAVEELRACAATDPYDQPPIILNACDPANQGPPASPETGGLTRIPSNYVALHDGKPVLLIEANGSRLRTTPFSSDDVLRRAMRSFLELTRLPEEIRGFRNITVEYIDGNRPAGGQHEAMLRSLGFRREKAQTMMFDDY
jgi:ATP-dependent Lhr-like helicase